MSQGQEPTEPFARLDAALLATRRITQEPSTLPGLRPGDARVELSTVLVVDALARAAGGTASVGDVAVALLVAPSTASRLVERAAVAGMVTRRRATDDPRRLELHLTDDGWRLQQEAVRFRTSRLRRMLAEWDVDDVAALAGLLERFADDVHRRERAIES